MRVLSLLIIPTLLFGGREKATELLDAGRDLYFAGDTEGALRLFLASSEEDPSFYKAWANAGDAYDRLGMGGEALEAYSRAVELKPTYFRVWYALGTLYLVGRKPDSAKAAFEAAVKAKPDYYEAWSGLGKVRGQLGDLDGSITALQTASELRPTDHKPTLILADAYFSAGRYEEALDAYSGALAIKPHDPKALEGVAGCYARLGRPGEAVKFLKDVVELRPKNGQAWKALGDAYTQLKQPDYREALKAYDRAVRETPRLKGAWYGMGLIHEKQKRWKNAVAVLEKCLVISPGDLDCRYHLASVLEQQRKYREAAQAFVRVFDGYPSKHMALYRAARNYALSGVRDSSYLYLRKAVAVRADYGPQAARDKGFASLHRENLFLVVTGQLPPADTLAALTENQLAARKSHNLGRQYLGSESYALAREAFWTSLRAVETAEAQAGLGWAYLGLGLPDSALVHFDRAAQMDSSRMEAREGAARSLLAQGKPEGALDRLEGAIRLDRLNYALYVLKAEAFALASLTDSAFAVLAWLNELVPGWAAGWAALGKLSWQERADRQGALKAYAKAVSLDRTLTSALREGAALRMSAGDYEGAAEWLRWAVEQDSSAEELYRLALSYGMLRKPGECAEALAAAFRLSPDLVERAWVAEELDPVRAHPDVKAVLGQ